MSNSNQRDPESTLLFLRDMRTTKPSAYEQLVRMYKKMADGGDGGQVEGWSFNSIRAEYYKDWSNDDFTSLLSFLGDES